jgi:hypothetical protein
VVRHCVERSEAAIDPMDNVLSSSTDTSCEGSAIAPGFASRYWHGVSKLSVELMTSGDSKLVSLLACQSDGQCSFSTDVSEVDEFLPLMRRTLSSRHQPMTSPPDVTAAALPVTWFSIIVLPARCLYVSICTSTFVNNVMGDDLQVQIRRRKQQCVMLLDMVSNPITITKLLGARTCQHT